MQITGIKYYTPIKQTQDFGISSSTDLQRVDEYLGTLKQYRYKDKSVKEQINTLEQIREKARKQPYLSTPFVYKYINVTKKILELEARIHYLNTLPRALTSEEKSEINKILQDAKVYLERQEELKTKILKREQ